MRKAFNKKTIERIFNASKILSVGIILFAFGLAACGGVGGSSTPATPAPTINVTASSTNIAAGQPVTLTWTTTGATSVDLAEQVSASSVSAQDSKVRLIAVSGPNSCALYVDPNYVHTEGETKDEGRAI